jgi:hypothetical protein
MRPFATWKAIGTSHSADHCVKNASPRGDQAARTQWPMRPGLRATIRSAPLAVRSLIVDLHVISWRCARRSRT